MRRRALLLAAAAACLASRPLRAQPLPWRAEELDWLDEARATGPRAVPVRIYWPTAAGSEPLPLVVFSHGIGGSRRGYSYLGQHLASAGFASLHVQHVGSDRSLWGGNLFQLAGRLRQAADEREALARALDVRFALDRLLAERPGHIDPSRLAVAGHSYGANTSLLLAGAAVPGAEGLHEPRFKAAVFISAPPLHGVDEPEKALAAVRLPSLHITATDDVIRVPGYYSEAKERVELYEQTGSPRKFLAVFEGGSHSVFTDRRGTGGAVQNPRIKEATKQLVADFLRTAFDDGLPRHERLHAWWQRHGSLLVDWRQG